MAISAGADLGLSPNGPLLTILPGSRSNEWHYHVRPFLETAAWLHDRHTGLRVAVTAVSEEARAVTVILGRAREVTAAAMPARGGTKAASRSRNSRGARESAVCLSGPGLGSE